MTTDADLVLEGIDFSYSGGRRVLRNVSWDLSGGFSSHLLVGPNGSGKSTLLEVLAGNLVPQGGRILLSGQPATRKLLYQHVAWMPQHVTPIANLRVVDQVRLSAWLAGRTTREAAQATDAALDAALLGRLAHRRVRRLSGGQLRRVGFAEALARGARVVLLDEPTAGLDDEGVAAMLKALSSANVRLVISTHEPEVFASLPNSRVTRMSDLDGSRRAA